MSRSIVGVVGVGLVLAAAGAFGLPDADAAYRTTGRQYYGAWSYNEISRYHYRSYYYKPVPTATTYSYHYVVSYPSRPRYVYYYNPVKRHYWGRYDVEAKGYSLLAAADRKEKLEDIKESAFPKPTAMPNMPEAADAVAMDAPPNDLPKSTK